MGLLVCLSGADGSGRTTLSRMMALLLSSHGLAGRADVPGEFIARELAVYGVLAKYVPPSSIDTCVETPLEALEDVLECPGSRGR